MIPWFDPIDIQMFYKYLDICDHYVEYGAGGSTYQAFIRTNIKTIYSIESDYTWIEKMKKYTGDKVNFIYCNMNTITNTGGNPGPDSTLKDWINYSDQIKNIDQSVNKINLILIDGRFRVASCLKCFDLINDKCFIAFDDYLDRPQYHIIEKYYDIIDTRKKRMVILKKKMNIISPSIQIIEKYEKCKD